MLATRLPGAWPAVNGAAAPLLSDVLLLTLPAVLLRFPISLTILAHSSTTLTAILPHLPIALAIGAQVPLALPAILAHLPIRMFCEPCVGAGDLVRHLELFGLVCTYSGERAIGTAALDISEAGLGAPSR